jgi:uncharacterized cupredoxin-like copper-binding protein
LLRRLHALLVLGLISFTACGGNSSDVRAADGVLRVRLDEYRLAPQDIVVPAGRVRLRATNVGRLTHNLQIETFDPDSGTEPVVYGRTDTLHPGESGAERAPIVLRAGRYRLTCTIANHDDLGQYGELTVER